MTAYITKLKDKTGNQQLPVTHERAVRDDNGTTLESKMQNLEGAMDRAYVAQSGNGMGRITLPKNNGVLTPSMMQATNTIYVIQYDFTLGQDITVPANCVLEFDGGSISGTYTLTGSNTIIEGNYKIFDSNIDFAGTFNCKVNIKWFGIVYNEVIDNSQKLNKALKLASLSTNKELKLEANGLIYVKGHYDETVDSYLTNGHVTIPSNTTLDLNGCTLKCITNSKPQYNILFSKETNNICIKNGIIEGDRETHTGSTGEWGYGISLMAVHGFVIENVGIKNCWGDGINLQYSGHYGDGDPTSATTKECHCMNGYITNCTISNNRRNGLSLEAVINATIKDCVFENTGGTAPESGMDFEPVSANNVCNNIIVSNCRFIKNLTYGILVAGLGKNISDIQILDNTFYDNINTWSIIVSEAKNVIFENCHSEDSTYLLRTFIKDDFENINFENCEFTRFVGGNSNTGSVKIRNCRFESDITHPKRIYGETLFELASNITCTVSNSKFKINSNNTDSNYIVNAAYATTTIKDCYFEGNQSKLNICGLNAYNSTFYKICPIIKADAATVLSNLNYCNFLQAGGTDYVFIIDDSSTANFSANINISNTVIDCYGDPTRVYLVKKVNVTPTVISMNVDNLDLKKLLYAYDNGINIQLGGSTVKSNMYVRTRESFLANSSYKGVCLFDSTLSPNKPIWWNGSSWVDATGATV